MAKKLSGRGGPARGRAQAGYRSADNLLMTAINGELDLLEVKRRDELVQKLQDVFREWVGDRFAKIKAAGYLFHLVTAKSGSPDRILFRVYDMEGKKILGPVPSIEMPMGFAGLCGVYCPQVRVAEGTFAFLSMARGRGGFGKIIEADEGSLTAKVARLRLRELIGDRHRNRYDELIAARPNKLAVVFILTVNKYEFMNGGMGMLEAYVPGDSGRSQRAHQRNLATIRTMVATYRGHAAAYKEKVKKAKDHAELRALGPPHKFFRFPTPAKLMQLPDHQKLFNELYLEAARGGVDAWYSCWAAVDERIHRIFEDIYSIKPPGALYFRLKLTVADTPDVGAGVYSRAEVEYNFDVNADGTTSQSKGPYKLVTTIDTQKAGEFSQKMQGSTGKTKGGFTYTRKLDPATGDEEIVVSGALGKYGIEVEPKAAKVKYGVGLFGVGVDNREGTVNFGTTILDLAGNKLEASVEAQFGKGAPIVVALSNAPGFFERRGLIELLEETRWNDLDRDEQLHLEAFGFDQASWDTRRMTKLNEYPKAIQGPYVNLNPRQKMAAAHLGFTNTLQWSSMWKKIALPPDPIVPPPPPPHRI